MVSLYATIEEFAAEGSGAISLPLLASSPYGVRQRGMESLHVENLVIGANGVLDHPPPATLEASTSIHS